MLDRLKAARPAETEGSDRTRPETKAETRAETVAETKFGDGLPRFQPQPGGFGRRTTPVGSNAGSAAPVAAQPKEIPAERVSSPQPRFHQPEPPAAAIGEPALGDIPTRIADWLMRELKDERGIHCETILTAIGALAGYAAQQALWEGMVKPGKLAIREAFTVVETSSGATYFFGDALDALIVSMEPKHLSIWKIVAGGALAGGGDHLPEMGNLLRHCAATVGTPGFGLPRLPDDHLPSIMPRAALDRFWPGARLFLTLAEPLHWPIHMAHAAQKLMQMMKGSIAPDLAVRIIMEAAVPMSRVDPATVPNN